MYHVVLNLGALAPFGSVVDVSKRLERAYSYNLAINYYNTLATGAGRRLFIPRAVGTGRASPEEATTPKRIPTARE